jgi:hypothetical protein
MTFSVLIVNLTISPLHLVILTDGVRRYVWRNYPA